MKSATPAALVLLAAAVAWVGFACRTNAQSAPPTTWEYKMMPLMYSLGDGTGDERNLSDLGADGWEVVAGVTEGSGGNAPGPATPRGHPQTGQAVTLAVAMLAGALLVARVVRGRGSRRAGAAQPSWTSPA